MTGVQTCALPIFGSVDPVGFSTNTVVVTSEDGITPKDRLSNPFPTGLLQAVGNKNGLLTLVGQNIGYTDPTDPLADVRTLENVTFVMKGGEVVKPAS